MSNEAQSTEQQYLDIQRVYVKDLSLEAPQTPDIFREEWKPEVGVDLDIKHIEIETEIYEVVLAVTVTAKVGEKNAFLTEVHQAGIFHIAGFKKEELEHVLNAYCPNLLFPYAREAISDLVTRATFPPLNLAHINFDALYLKQKEEQAEGKANTH